MAAGSYIIQKYEIAPLFPCTLSVLLANGTILASTFTEIGGKAIPRYGVFDIEDTYVAINNTNSVEIKAFKLELVTVSTLANDPPADFGVELAKCQRFALMSGKGIMEALSLRPEYAVLHTPTTLRATPAIISSPHVYSIVSNLPISGATMQVRSLMQNGVILSISGTSELAYVYFPPNSGISADL